MPFFGQQVSHTPGKRRDQCHWALINCFIITTPISFPVNCGLPRCSPSLHTVLIANISGESGSHQYRLSFSNFQIHPVSSPLILPLWKLVKGNLAQVASGGQKGRLKETAMQLKSVKGSAVNFRPTPIPDRERGTLHLLQEINYPVTQPVRKSSP